VKWIEEDIARYATFYDTLKTHAPGFPTPAELKAVTFVGNISNVSEMDRDTPGSDRIVEVLLDDKPGPIYLQAWGGTNTIARALWKIQHQHPGQMARVSRKAVSTRTRPSASTSSPTGPTSRCWAASASSPQSPTRGRS